MDDSAIVAGLRARDEDAFRQLVETWTPVMTRVARTHVSTDASADEVVQDTWLGVLRGIDAFEGRSSLRTWTFRILTNIAKTRGAREHRSVLLTNMGGWTTFRTAWPSAEEVADGAATGERVRQLIDELPERQRLVIHLRDELGFSSAEVCELLALTQANQRVLLHRARAAVRAGLELSYVAGSVA